MRINKEQKIINHYWNELTRPELNDYQQKIIILEAIYKECELQKHKTEQEKDFAGQNAIEFHYEELASRANNRNNFIDLAFYSRNLKEELEQKSGTKKDRN